MTTFSENNLTMTYSNVSHISDVLKAMLESAVNTGCQLTVVRRTTADTDSETLYSELKGLISRSHNYKVPFSIEIEPMFNSVQDMDSELLYTELRGIASHSPTDTQQIA